MVAERLGVEVERLLRPHQAPVGHEQLEQLVPLVALHAELGRGPPRDSAAPRRPGESPRRGRSPRAAARGSDRIVWEARRTWSFSLRTTPSASRLVRSWAKTRSCALPARLRSSSREMPGAQRVLGVKRLEQPERLRAQAVVGLAVQIPLAIDGDDGARPSRARRAAPAAARGRRACGRADRPPARPPPPPA